VRHDDLPRFAERQLALLRSAADGVRPGGTLVYATCSLFRVENERVIERFLTARPEFCPEPFPHPLTGASAAGLLSLWPWDGDNDAMFVARLRRVASSQVSCGGSAQG
jgi:16S rRNA (cytosine967-C5)-methyltransferase